MKEKEEALKEKDRLLANAIEGMRGKGMDTGVIASILGLSEAETLGLSEAAMDRYVHGLSAGIQANSVRFTGLTVDCTLFVFPPPLCFSGAARCGSGCRERVAGESRPWRTLPYSPSKMAEPILTIVAPSSMARR